MNSFAIQAFTYAEPMIKGLFALSFSPFIKENSVLVPFLGGPMAIAQPILAGIAISCVLHSVIPAILFTAFELTFLTLTYKDQNKYTSILKIMIITSSVINTVAQGIFVYMYPSIYNLITTALSYGLLATLATVELNKRNSKEQVA